MALELQLSTDKAQRAVENIERSLDSLRLSLDKIATGTAGFNAFTAQLSSVKGVNPAAVESIKELGRAAGALSGAGNLANLSNALSKLASLDVTKAALGVRTLVAALNSVRVPPGLDTLASHLDRIAKSSQMAAAGLRAMAAASNFRLPSVGNVASQFNQVASSAQRAGQATAYFGSVASNLKQGLTALGIAAIGREFGQFVVGAYEAQVAFDKFNAIVNNAAGSGTAPKYFQFLQAVAKESATDIGTLTNAFPRFLQTLKTAGATAPEVGDAFRKVTIAFRGFGLSAEESKGAMNAVIQMFQKGKVSAEELRQQLGDRGVPAMNAFAQALGVTVPELDKLVESGKLGATEVMKFIDTLYNMGKDAVAGQIAKIGAQMTLLNNAFINLKSAFGAGFFDPVIFGLQQLNAALQSPLVLKFAQAIGFLTGAIAGGLLTALSMMIQAVATVSAPIIQLGAAIYKLGQDLLSSDIGKWVVELAQMAGIASIVSGAIYVLAGAVGVATTAWAVYRTVMAGVAIASAAASLAMSPVLLTVLAISGGVLLAVEAYRAMRGESSLLTDASARVAEVFGAVKRSAGELTGELTYTGQQAQEAGNGISNVGINAADTTNKMSSLAAANIKTADTFGDVAVQANAAAGAIQQASTAGSMSGGGGGGGGGGNGGWQENSRWKFGDYAAGRAIDAEFSNFDFSSGGMFSRAGGYSEGGMNGQVVKKVSTALFAGAPRFAQGGTTTGMSGSLPDGGIPSILHPNEAVVPLDAGGKIPVQQTGNGGQAIVSALSREFGRANGILQEINKGVATVKENVNAVGVVIKTESDRHLTELQAHQRLLGELGKAMGAVVTAVEQAMARAGTGGVGGGVVGDGTSVGLPGAASAPTGGRRWMVGQSQFGDADYKPLTDSGGRTRYGAWATSSDGGSTGSTGTKSVLPGTAARTRGFATGSPNAFRDVMRGAAAPVAIHPDEAIVPLPDGRRVPVELRGLDLPHRPRPIREDSGFMPTRRNNTSGGSSAPNINITMNIQTPDARSFRNSQDQITQQLVQRINRATRTLGTPSDSDDPTRPTALINRNK